jgi:nucleotide-binding universal stress UspA family protein
VVRLTDLPVLVHKDYPRQNGNRSVKNVLYATDFGAAASRAFGYVPAFGSNDAALTLLHVGERGADPEAEKARQKWVSVRLAEKRASLEGHYGLVRTESLLGAPHRRILQVAKSMAADMILVGRFNDNPIRKIVGSTLERISDKAHCSLFVVP